MWFSNVPDLIYPTVKNNSILNLVNNFDTNDSDMNFILLQRRFDASCIIFKLQVRTIRITITFN